MPISLWSNRLHLLKVGSDLESFSGMWLQIAIPEEGCMVPCWAGDAGNTPCWWESPSHHSHTLHPQPDSECLAMTLDILHKFMGLLDLCEEAVLAHTVLTDSGGKGQKEKMPGQIATGPWLFSLKVSSHPLNLHLQVLAGESYCFSSLAGGKRGTEFLK